MTQIYDQIGHGYKDYRQPDPRIYRRILAALGDAETVLNVGAGAGSYEPNDRNVVAAEPAFTMLKQRRSDSAKAVCASGVQLPFNDKSFDASLAVLTMHHWPDQVAGLRELLRVTRQRIVILTWMATPDPFWLVRDYFPEILANDLPVFPEISFYEDVLGQCDKIPVPIPHDCTDGFLCAYWRRPEAYLDAGARSAISSFAKLPTVEQGLAKLARDLQNGVWQQRNQALLTQDALDAGYCLVVSQVG